MAEQSLLRVHGVGEIPAEYAARVLFCMNSAYDGLWMLDQLRSTGRTQIRKAIPMLRDYWADTPLNLAFPAARHSLELKRVILRSPGFWEFLGALNPLETIRKFLTDRHERKKDDTYRNQAEAKKLHLENKVLEIKLVSETIDALRKASIPDDQIAAIIRDLVLIPTYQLESLQDKQVITYADMPKEKKSDVPEEVDA